MEIENRKYTLIAFRLFFKEKWVGYITSGFKYNDETCEVVINLAYRIPKIGNKWELIEKPLTFILNKQFELDEIRKVITSSNPYLLAYTFEAETKSWIFNFKSNPEKTIMIKEFLYEPTGFEITDLEIDKSYVLSDCSEDDLFQFAFENFIL